MPATFVTVRGGLYLPREIPPFQAAPTFTTLVTMADSNDKAAWIFRVPKTGNTKSVGFRIGTLTTPQDIRVAFQDVSATNGDPDGVDDQTVIITSASLAAGWNTSGTITRAVTRGDLLACVLIADSGTPNLTISVPQYDTTGNAIEFPYADAFTTAYTKTSRCGCFALQYDDNSYEPIDGFVYPISTLNTVAFNNGTTPAPDEQGLKFQVPYTCKVDGAWFLGDIDGDADLVLYDSNGTSVLLTVSLDKDTDPNPSPGLHYATFSSKATLTAATYYRLVLKPTSATNITMYDFEVPSAAHLDMCELGQLAHHTGRVDAGAWTDTTTKRPWMGVRISDVQTDPGTATGGGALVNAGLAHAG